MVGSPSSPTATSWACRAHGGYTEYQRVPAGWVVPLAPGLTPRDAMSIGTAGSPRRCPWPRSRPAGCRPTGRAGDRGLGRGGRDALAILADRGYEVWAATGKPDEADRLVDGAAGS